MVSNRCKTIVREELNRHNMSVLAVDLGYVDLRDNISNAQREQLKIALLISGLVLMDDQRAILIKRMKAIIIEMVCTRNEHDKTKLSEFLSDQLNHDYTYLSEVFTETCGITIEQFVISQKIERVKELLISGEMNLTTIAYELNYSSVAHLSNQFKKVTGLTPTSFKLLKQ